MAQMLSNFFARRRLQQLGKMAQRRLGQRPAPGPRFPGFADNLVEHVHRQGAQQQFPGFANILGGHERQYGSPSNRQYSSAFIEHQVPLNRKEIAGFEREAVRQDPIEAMRQTGLEQSFGEVQVALNSRGILARNRSSLPVAQREAHDLRVLFMQALLDGAIRNTGNERAMLADFQLYLRRFFTKMRQNPEFAQLYQKDPLVYANQALNRFKASFYPQEFVKLVRSVEGFGEARKR